MKFFKKIMTFILLSLFVFPQNVFAEAYLEGEAVEESGSFLDGLDSTMIMANWYKIVIIIVVSLCVIGLVVGNIVWYVKKRNK